MNNKQKRFADMVKEEQETNMPALATKGDLHEVRLEIKAAKTEVILWVVIVGLAQIALVLTIIMLH